MFKMWFGQRFVDAAFVKLVAADRQSHSKCSFLGVFPELHFDDRNCQWGVNELMNCILFVQN